MKMLHKYTCTKCNNEIEAMSEGEPRPNFVCCVCKTTARFASVESKQLDGAPRGYVRGSWNPVKQ